MRLAVVWCADWPVTAACIAAGVPLHHPAAVLRGNRVVACSAVARRHGVRRGMRRRQAQSSCPELAVLDTEPARDARLFEPVAAAVESVVVGVDVVRPGVVAAPSTGAVGYFGGEHFLTERLIDAVQQGAGVECAAGMADGLFAAILAARRDVLVDPGGNAAFLAPLPITELQHADPDDATGDLVDLLRRLGLRTLGQFAELSERVVTSRFGASGVLAHRRARGLSERPLARRKPADEIAVSQVFDPPLDRIDAAATVARTLGTQLQSELAARDMACTRLGISAVTEADEELTRSWRCAEPLDAHRIGERVRWQLDSWLSSRAGPSSGLVRLRLEPDEIVGTGSLQQGLWRGGGADDVTDERAGRALSRVQELLGPNGAVTPVLSGGRGPRERVRLVPWGDPVDPPEPQPWPGRLPPPSPTTVYRKPVTARVVDAAGVSVRLTARGRLSAAPQQVTVDGRQQPVRGWAGPWPVDERWWIPGNGASVGARLQAVLGSGEALLLLHHPQRSPEWIVEGRYD